MAERPCDSRRLMLASLAWACILAPVAEGAEATPAVASPKAASYRDHVRPLLAKYCNECHAGPKAKGGLDFDRYAGEESIGGARKVWDRVKDYIESGEMPPEDKPAPSEAEVDLLSRWIGSRLEATQCGDELDPGRVTIRRLNRAEYNNTIRDLFGLDFRPADDFPSDDVGYGFDNIGDVLTLPPILFEKYLDAAEQIADRAIRLPGEPDGTLKAWKAEELDPSAGGQPIEGRGRRLGTDGSIAVPFAFPTKGEYTVRVRAFGEQAGDQPVRMAIEIDGKRGPRIDVKAVEGDPKWYEGRGRMAAPGLADIAIVFLNDYWKPNADGRGGQDRNLVVERIELLPPRGVQVGSRQRLVTRTPAGPSEVDARARETLAPFARRAYRRPVRPEELDRLAQLVKLATDDGDSFEAGIRLAVQAVLVSPHFLFRVEIEPKRKDGEVRSPLGAFEMASRLSYFLWSSMPDDALLSAAEDKSILRPEGLEVQVARMLKDPKAAAFVENFAGQWLQLRNLRTVFPDWKRFPEWKENLREAMQRETELFFTEIVREDRSILDFLDADYTYLNGRLADHYGIPNIKGDEFRRVTLPKGRRGGVLTQASILTITSNPTRTSPVKRGKWILDQILGEPPAPPPPDTPELEEGRRAERSAPLRQRLEAHRANPSCATCHNRMDPLGFGFENFDPIGRWRDKDGTFAIDASGTLPSGQSFNGPDELKAILVGTKADDFSRCLTEKLLTYAIGRGVEPADDCVVDRIAASMPSHGYRFGHMISEIVKSEPFRERSVRGENRP